MVITAAREGEETDLDPFSRAYADAHDRVVRLAYVLTGDAGAAEELAHDAWVNTYRRHTREPVEAIEAYVRRAVVNGARSRARRGALERAYLRVVRREVDQHTDDHAVVGDRMALIPLLQRLPERMRTAVALRFYADLSVADTAAEMGVTEGTVKSTVSKALGHLRAMWEEEVLDG